MNQMLKTVVAAAAGTLLSVSAQAQDWPRKPVTLIVPFTAGTTSDVIARSFADYLTGKLGVGVIVDNKGGAGGNIGGGAAAKAAPDGYTFLFATTGPAATNKLMYKDMTYDPQKDLAPVGLLGKARQIAGAGVQCAPPLNLREHRGGLDPLDQVAFGGGELWHCRRV